MPRPRPNCVIWGPSFPKRDTAHNFRPMSVVARRLDGSRCQFMPLGREVEVGLVSGDIMLDEDPAPPKVLSPQFSAHVCCGQTAEWIPRKGTSAPDFRLMCIVAKCLDGCRYHLVRTYDSAQATLYRTNPITFIAILTTFKTLFSKCHFALLSSPDFHAVIVLHGSHAVHHFTY